MNNVVKLFNNNYNEKGTIADAIFDLDDEYMHLTSNYNPRYEKPVIRESFTGLLFNNSFMNYKLVNFIFRYYMYIDSSFIFIIENDNLYLYYKNTEIFSLSVDDLKNNDDYKYQFNKLKENIKKFIKKSEKKFKTKNMCFNILIFSKNYDSYNIENSIEIDKENLNLYKNDDVKSLIDIIQKSVLCKYSNLEIIIDEKNEILYLKINQKHDILKLNIKSIAPHHIETYKSYLKKIASNICNKNYIVNNNYTVNNIKIFNKVKIFKISSRK